ncbi:ClpS-like protein [Neoconidiobolus thromboides FSU 785]|nr:ClpS-like protein [Neoconidiobolus thromboides FSU 785]
MSLSLFARRLTQRSNQITKLNSKTNLRLSIQSIKKVAYYSDVATKKVETPGEKTEVSPKINEIVDKIATLSLLETADLIEALKLKLNISEIAMPSASAAAPAAAAPATEAAEEEKPAAKSIFTVKLEKFDAASKAKIIREIKSILPGANLVEAKKFVESAPKVIRTDVPKEEAEKIKATLEAIGATIALE